MNNNKYHLKYAMASILGAAIFAATPALAQVSPATGQVAATANVTANCAVSATPLQFGDTDVTDGLDHTGTTTLSVKCTSGTIWTAKADQGLGLGASPALRKMTFNGNTLNYKVFSSNSQTSALWGDAADSGTTTITGTGTGVAVPSILDAVIPGGQNNLPKGLYQDTIAVTVSY